MRRMKGSEAMPVSEAQKKAADKYNREHMTTLGCKVKKAEAAAFKEYAARNGKTSNNMLKDYVIDCISIDEHMERDNRNEMPTVEAVPGEPFQLSPEEVAHIEKRRVVMGQAAGSAGTTKGDSENASM
jgi:hypothetical protein